MAIVLYGLLQLATLLVHVPQVGVSFSQHRVLFDGQSAEVRRPVESSALEVDGGQEQQHACVIRLLPPQLHAVALGCLKVPGLILPVRQLGQPCAIGHVPHGARHLLRLRVLHGGRQRVSLQMDRFREKKNARRSFCRLRPASTLPGRLSSSLANLLFDFSQPRAALTVGLAAVSSELSIN